MATRWGRINYRARMEMPSTSVQAGRGIGGAAPLALLLLAMIGIGWASIQVSALADAETVARARAAVESVVAGRPAEATEGGIAALSLLAAVILVKPLIVLGLFLAIERWIGPRERAAKRYRLIWTVQFAFLAIAAAMELALARLQLMPTDPLIRVAPGSGPVEALLWVAPFYLLSLLIADFFRYWLHRAQHRFAWLWRFHAVHHSQADLDVLHNVTHPVDQFGNYLLIAIPTALLIGVDNGQLFLLAAFFAIHTHLIHMNVPIHFGRMRNLICDNRYHFQHHSRRREDFDTNFAGMFPLLDMLFGTYRRPDPERLPETGIDGRGAPVSLADFLAARLARPRASPGERDRD